MRKKIKNGERKVSVFLKLIETSDTILETKSGQCENGDER